MMPRYWWVIWETDAYIHERSFQFLEEAYFFRTAYAPEGDIWAVLDGKRMRLEHVGW